MVSEVRYGPTSNEVGPFFLEAAEDVKCAEDDFFTMIGYVRVGTKCE